MVALAALLLWAPWLNSASAKERAEQYFLSAWQGVADGCGLSCKGCGGVGTQRVMGGWMVTIELCLRLDPGRYTAVSPTGNRICLGAGDSPWVSTTITTTRPYFDPSIGKIMRILMLDIDTLRPDHLGCYGYHRNTSPNIDRIAQPGYPV